MRPGDHGFLAAVLAPGMRAVTIAVDNTTGSAGLIWPGDQVDLILTADRSTKPNLPIGHRVAAETVLSNARVIAIDQQIMQGAVAAPDSQAKTVTLEVTEEQAERVSVATRLGRLSLSVRSAEDAQRTRAATPRPRHDLGGRCVAGPRGNATRLPRTTSFASTKAAAM